MAITADNGTGKGLYIRLGTTWSGVDVQGLKRPQDSIPVLRCNEGEEGENVIDRPGVESKETKSGLVEGGEVQ